MCFAQRCDARCSLHSGIVRSVPTCAQTHRNKEVKFLCGRRVIHISKYTYMYMFVCLPLSVHASFRCKHTLTYSPRNPSADGGCVIWPRRTQTQHAGYIKSPAAAVYTKQASVSFALPQLGWAKQRPLARTGRFLRKGIAKYHKLKQNQEGMRQHHKHGHMTSDMQSRP